MASSRWGIVSVLITLAIHPISSFQSVIQLQPEKENILASDGVSEPRRGIDLYCESWRFTVETNDAGSWTTIPERCVDFVKDFITGPRYREELEAVSENAVAYVKRLEVSDEGKDAWIFDIDETLLSNVPYYADHGFGSENYEEVSFGKWVGLAEAAALPGSLQLYKELEELGITIFLLTGRAETQRNCTETNLLNSGFRNWKRLILRGDNDHGKSALLYKSEKRKEIEDEGYRIRGSSGDQWSDLLGFSVAQRSFKLPNPLYFIA